jgi:hypothetical protein
MTVKIKGCRAFVSNPWALLLVALSACSSHNKDGTGALGASGSSAIGTVTGGAAATTANTNGAAAGATASAGTQSTAAAGRFAAASGTGGASGAAATAAAGASGAGTSTAGTSGGGGGPAAGTSGTGEVDVPCTGDKGAAAVVQSYTQTGQPPSGPIPIVIETEPTLAGYTIYRPKDLTEKYPQFVFMDGSCTLEGVGAFSEILSEVASYGFIAIVVGDPTANGSEALSTDPTSLLKPLDWLYAEADRPCSKYYHKILKDKAAASGQSCGGVHAIGAGKDPRVATVVPLNSGLSGMATDAQTALSALHGSIAYLIGGSSDLAYSPAEGDYPALPKSLPAWYGNFGDVGHFYIFGQDNGGEFGRVTVAWLRWQLKGETGADTKGLFVGTSCGLCSGTDWVIKSQNLN